VINYSDAVVWRGMTCVTMSQKCDNVTATKMCDIVTHMKE